MSTKKVTLTLKKILLDSKVSNVTIRYGNSTNDKKHIKPITQLTSKTGKLTLTRRNRGGIELTNYEKARLTVTNIELPRSSKSLSLDIVDGVPMAAIGIGQSKISIGRERKKMKKYKWRELHKILNYGEQVAKALRKQNTNTVKLLVLTKNHSLIRNHEVVDPDFAVEGHEHKSRESNLLLLPKKNKIITIHR
jgi:hypothetical protein